MSSVLEAQAMEVGAEPLQTRTVALPAVWRPRVAQASGRDLSDWQEEARHAANVVIALLLLIVASPLMLLIAVLTRLTSGGPVIYVQTRVGVDRRRGRPTRSIASRRRVDYGGRLFRIYKFRTMTWNPDATLQVWAREADPRVTPLGRVLRKYRLDELPQLVNVLKGDMNLVGPRPEQPRLFAELREEIDGYGERQRVLPGITGWAQVNRGYDGCLEDVKKKVRLDLEYVSRATVTRDLEILARTIPVILFQRGAR